jgi:cation:H+ antiporter
MVRPLMVVDRVVSRDLPIMIFMTLFLFPFLMDGSIGRLDGLVLTGALAVYLAYVFHRGKNTPPPLITEYSRLAEEAKGRKAKALVMDVGLLLAGTAGLLLGGRAIVESATYLAVELGISELTVGLTIVALGTSLPELATSVLAAVRKQTDIAVGNVIGSNIFNITGVIGLTGTVRTVEVDPGVVWREFPAVMVLSLLALLVPLFPLAKGAYLIRRWEGALLLGAYFGLFYWIL